MVELYLHFPIPFYGVVVNFTLPYLTARIEALRKSGGKAIWIQNLRIKWIALACSMILLLSLNKYKRIERKRIR
jgi:hypothetical protein